jgi:hypothetical protein
MLMLITSAVILMRGIAPNHVAPDALVRGAEQNSAGLTLDSKCMLID